MGFAGVRRCPRRCTCTCCRGRRQRHLSWASSGQPSGGFQASLAHGLARTLAPPQASCHSASSASSTHELGLRRSRWATASRSPLGGTRPTLPTPAAALLPPTSQISPRPCPPPPSVAPAHLEEVPPPPRHGGHQWVRASLGHTRPPRGCTSRSRGSHAPAAGLPTALAAAVQAVQAEAARAAEDWGTRSRPGYLHLGCLRVGRRRLQAI